VLCTLLKDPAAKQYLAESLFKQRARFSVLAMVFAGIGIQLMVVPLRVEAARRLNKRIAEREQQLQLPL